MTWSRVSFRHCEPALSAKQSQKFWFEIASAKTPRNDFAACKLPSLRAGFIGEAISKNSGSRLLRPKKRLAMTWVAHKLPSLRAGFIGEAISKNLVRDCFGKKRLAMTWSRVSFRRCEPALSAKQSQKILVRDCFGKKTPRNDLGRA